MKKGRRRKEGFGNDRGEGEGFGDGNDTVGRAARRSVGWGFRERVVEGCGNVGKGVLETSNKYLSGVCGIEMIEEVG